MWWLVACVQPLREPEARAWAARHDARIAAVEQYLTARVVRAFPPFTCPDPPPRPEVSDPVLESLRRELWCTDWRSTWWEAREQAVEAFGPVVEGQIRDDVIGLELRVAVQGARDGYFLRAGDLHLTGLTEQLAPEHGPTVGLRRLGWGRIWRPKGPDPWAIVTVRTWTAGENDLTLTAVLLAEPR